jgi:hypothetical protein
MQTPEIEALAHALAETSSHLRRYGATSTSDRLTNLEARLDRGDMTAIPGALSEATGGMGSLNDRYLCAENGDAIRPDETEAVNRQLTLFVEEVERSARAAAAVCGVDLMR